MEWFVRIVENQLVDPCFKSFHLVNLTRRSILFNANDASYVVPSVSSHIINRIPITMFIVLSVTKSLQNSIFLFINLCVTTLSHAIVGYPSLFHLSPITIDLNVPQELFIVAFVVRNIDLMDKETSE